MNATSQPAEASVLAKGPRQYLTFLLEDRVYGVPLADVAEISPNRELNRMPHMPKGVEGLLDLRGTMLPVMNLRARLDLPPLPAEGAHSILVLNHGGQLMGLLVDQVSSVLTSSSEAHVAAGPLLAGRSGAWVSGFLLEGDQIIVLLDTNLVLALGQEHTRHQSDHSRNLEREMDESLQRLIDLAPEKHLAEKARIIPQMETAIQHTEDEMGKVVQRIEQMLTSVDVSFQSMARLKQEANLGRLPGREALLAQLDQNTQALQDQVFELLNQTQFQDIARQKLERVLNHIRGLQLVMGKKFRDAGLER